VRLQRTKLGLVLAASNGHTLYVFLRDRGVQSTCYGACAKAWPPLLKGSGRLVAGRVVRGRLLGAAHRREGRVQVTYHHRPLYAFSGDASPDEVNGEGLESFGGRWYAISASGALVKPKHSRRRP
jgi:predicted lipoprotein with Yx(FWY)xxD motif